MISLHFDLLCLCEQDIIYRAIKVLTAGALITNGIQAKKHLLNVLFVIVSLLMVRFNFCRIALMA